MPRALKTFGSRYRHVMHGAWATVRALVLVLALSGGAGAALAQVDAPPCGYSADALYEVARADAAWLGEVVGIREISSSGDSFVVFTKGSSRVRTTTVFKGVAPHSASKSWMRISSDDGQLEGGPPIEGALYFVTKEDGELSFTPSECVARLSDLPPASPPTSPEPTGAALVAAGKAERLNGDPQRARGMTLRGRSQVYETLMRYEKWHRRGTPGMYWDYLLATVESGQIGKTLGDPSACQEFRLADSLVKIAEKKGFDTTEVQAELDSPAVKNFCAEFSKPPPSAASPARPRS